MSIFLKTKEMFDMPLDGDLDIDKQGNPINKRITYWFGNLAYVFIGIFCKICWRYKVINKKQLRDLSGKTGAIVIANHSSFMDAPFVYLAARPGQWIRPVAREDLFEVAHGLLGQILSRVGGFPISRDSADRTALKRAVKMVKRKELVGIMPEGTRRGKGSADICIHSGFAFIAKMASDAPVLPMCLRNVDRIKMNGKFLRFPRVEIEFGNPRFLSEFDWVEKSIRLQAFSWYMMREVFALKNKCKREDVNMKELFPNDEDFSKLFNK